MKPVQTYETSEIKVTFDPNTCTHSGICVRGLPSVFDVKRKPWISPGEATPEEVGAQVATCPSGALKFERKGG